MRPLSTADIADLEARVRKLRRFGDVYFYIGPAAEDWHLTRPFTDALDAVAKNVGLDGLGSGFSGWHSLSRDEAQKMLVMLSRKDLAYGVTMMTDEEAVDLAERFLGMFEHALFFSNRLLASDTSWSPLTEATFDGGVVAIRRERCGILWFADED